MQIDVYANKPQSQFLSLHHKFKAFVAGFGSGKTWVGCMDMCSHVWQWPKINSGYFAPTYPQIRDIFYPTIEEVAYNFGLNVKIKLGDKEVQFFSGKQYRSTCICRSMERPGTIIGFKIGFALVDELDTMAINKADLAWKKIIARMRYNVPGLKNGIDVTTTPEGFKFTYKLFVSEKTDSYGLVHGSTYDNELNLPVDYIPSLIETYPENLISAYLNGQFVNLTTGTIYYGYNRLKHRSNETIQEKEPLYIGQDFNVGKMASVVFVQRSGNVFHAVDELKGIFDTPALINTLTNRYPEHNITIFPDASGDNRKTVNASTSDIALLRQAGFNVRVKNNNPFVKDRILSVNTGFEKGRLKVNDKLCKFTAECLEKQAYDENGEPDKESGFDHQNDAFGYFTNLEMPVVKPVIVTNIRMGR